MSEKRHRVVMRAVVPRFVVYYAVDLVELEDGELEVAGPPFFDPEDAVVEALVLAQAGECEYPFDDVRNAVVTARDLPRARREPRNTGAVGHWAEWVPHGPDPLEVRTVEEIVEEYPRQLVDLLDAERRRFAPAKTAEQLVDPGAAESGE